MSENLFKKLDDIQKSLDELKKEKAGMGLPTPDGKEILNRFLKTSYKEYVYMGTRADFENKKKRTTLFLWAFMGISLLVTIVCSIALHIYSTFTLFENIWAVCAGFMLYYTYSAEYYYNAETYALRSIDNFYVSALGLWASDGTRKKRYKWFFVLACISSVLNMICSFTMEGAAVGLVIFFEIIYLAACIFTYKYYDDFFLGYGSVRFTGKNASGTQTVHIFFDNLSGKYLTEEEHAKQYPWIDK